MKQSTNVIPNEKTVLRDQIIEDSRGAALRCKLLKIVGDKPDSRPSRCEKQSLSVGNVEYSRSHCPRVVKATKLIHRFAIKTINDQCNVGDDVQREVAGETARVRKDTH